MHMYLTRDREKSWINFITKNLKYTTAGDWNIIGTSDTTTYNTSCYAVENNALTLKEAAHNLLTDHASPMVQQSLVGQGLLIIKAS
jgi:hypothetical protein